MKKLILASLLWLWGISGVAQPLPRQYNFTHFTEETGLISYQVNSTIQDEEGYIWIATNEGLQRYDGVRHKNFRPQEANHTSIPSKSIAQLIQDSRKNMWLLTEDGRVGIFNTKSFVFKEAGVQFKYSRPMSSLVSPQRLISDQHGNVFLLMPGWGLLTYSKESNEFSETNNFFETPKDWEIMDFVQEPGTKKYWLCLGNQGIAVYDGDKGSLSTTGNNRGQESLLANFIPTANPYKLLFDSRGRIWYTSKEDNLPYIYAFDPATGDHFLERYGFSIEMPRYHEVNAFLEQQDGSLWISGINIFARYLESNKQFQQVANGNEYERGINYVVITDIREDRERNLWVGTGNNGLYRFNPEQEFFKSISHPSKLSGNIGSGAPITFRHDLDGSILVGVWGDGLYRYDKNLKSIPLGIQGYPENKITPVLQLSPSFKGDYIWMAVADGIYRYDQENRTVDWHHFPDLNSRIREVREDWNGLLWIGLQEHGLFTWDPENQDRGLIRFPDIPSGRINDIMIDRKGLIWIATYGSGLYLVDPGTMQVLSHFHADASDGLKLPERSVTAILDYNDSLIIVGTRNHLIKYNRELGKMHQFTRNTTITGAIQAMERDSEGYIWFSTSAGIYRFTPERRIFIKFNRKDGIINDYFILGASHNLPDGRMLFGASSTMVAFNPKDIRINTSYPTVHMTDFRVMNRSLPLDSLLNRKRVNLPAGKNTLSMDLSTMSHTTAYAVRYKLEGLEADWNFTDNSYQLNYSYLPPGDYRLRAVAINSEGIEGDNPLILDISIATPFWRSWWFLSLLVISLGFALYLLDKARMQRKEAVYKMRSEIAANLHQEVNTALGNINILSEMARKKAETDPGKSKQFIDQIHSKSHNMIFALDDMLWSIAPENDSMEKTLDRMKEYIQALNNRNNSCIELLVDNRVKRLNLNMHARYESFLLFKELIRSLVKSGNGTCHIHLTLDKDHLLYSIQLSNECCERDELYQLEHRQDMVKRLSTLNADYHMELHKNQSVIELRIPLAS